MSYAHEVKKELCARLPESAESRRAQFYGMLLFGRRFGSEIVAASSEHACVSELCASLFGALFSFRPSVRAHKRADGRMFTEVSVRGEKARAVFESFGHGGPAVSLRINRANFEADVQFSDFLRGAFLSCGSMVDPQKDYHLEFVTPHFNLGRDLFSLLTEQSFEPKEIRRGGKSVVYFKDSRQIEDVLTYMGATNHSLTLMNIKIYKDFRNKANRVTNCETANIDKTVNAAAEQVAAIKKLLNTHGYECLPEELRETARLRLAHPDLSLRELGRLMEKPLSRSGVNHRLRRILAFAKDL